MAELKPKTFRVRASFVLTEVVPHSVDKTGEHGFRLRTAHHGVITDHGVIVVQPSDPNMIPTFASFNREDVVYGGRRLAELEQQIGISCHLQADGSADVVFTRASTVSFEFVMNLVDYGTYGRAEAFDSASNNLCRSDARVYNFGGPEQGIFGVANDERIHVSATDIGGGDHTSDYINYTVRSAARLYSTFLAKCIVGSAQTGYTDVIPLEAREDVEAFLCTYVTDRSFISEEPGVTLLEVGKFADLLRDDPVAERLLHIDTAGPFLSPNGYVGDRVGSINNTVCDYRINCVVTAEPRASDGCEHNVNKLRAQGALASAVVAKLTGHNKVVGNAMLAANAAMSLMSAAPKPSSATPVRFNNERT